MNVAKGSLTKFTAKFLDSYEFPFATLDFLALQKTTRQFSCFVQIVFPLGYPFSLIFLERLSYCSLAGHTR